MFHIFRNCTTSGIQNNMFLDWKIIVPKVFEFFFGKSLFWLCYYRTDQEHTHNDFSLALIDFNTKVKPDQQIEENVDTCPRQQTLSHAIDSNTLETIHEASRNNVHFQAHINHTTASGAGSWLHTVPAKALGTDVDPLLFRTMIQQWLRVPIQESEPFLWRYSQHLRRSLPYMRMRRWPH